MNANESTHDAGRQDSPVVYRLKTGKSPDRVGAAELSLLFRMFSQEGRRLLAAKEMACDLQGLSPHWTSGYSRLQSLAVSFPEHLSVCPFSLSAHLHNICFCQPLGVFPPSASLEKMVLCPCSSADPGLCLLNGQREGSLAFKNGLFFKTALLARQTSPVSACLPTAEGSSAVFAPQLCPLGAALQASSCSLLPFQVPRCYLCSPGGQRRPHCRVLICFGRDPVISTRPRVLGWAFWFVVLGKLWPYMQHRSMLLGWGSTVRSPFGLWVGSSCCMLSTLNAGLAVWLAF